MEDDDDGDYNDDSKNDGGDDDDDDGDETERKRKTTRVTSGIKSPLLLFLELFCFKLLMLLYRSGIWLVHLFRH